MGKAPRKLRGVNNLETVCFSKFKIFEIQLKLFQFACVPNNLPPGYGLATIVLNTLLKLLSHNVVMIKP